MNVASLQRQMKNGAYNFHWIAGISMITSIFFVISNRPGLWSGWAPPSLWISSFTTLRNPFPIPRSSSNVSGCAWIYSFAGVFVLCGCLAVKKIPLGLPSPA